MSSEISTIQLSKKTKSRLHSLKKNSSESYEEVINRVLSREQALYEDLKKGYLEQYDDLKKINEEWADADSSW